VSVARHLQFAGVSVDINSFSQLTSVTPAYSPRKKWYRRMIKRSAVAIILREQRGGLEALMIKRAERNGDPWSGHMAFPGGVAERRDRNNLHTARRETFEEVGLDTELHAQCLGRLSDVLARRHRGNKPMIVTPYLFTIDEVPELQPNHEVADVLWVPLSFLANDANRESMQWKMKRVSWTLPCYFYQQERIWGLSLIMLDELLAVLKLNAGSR
jgi:8-oxo-dGTP pyrophosphatase MutT (NUDIX family)